MEYRLRRHDGEYRWVLDNAAPLFEADGSFAGYIGACFDVTDFIAERKDAEESLRRKEMELKEAQRLAGVGSWQWDPDSDTVVWSEELYRIAGRDPGLPAVSYKEHGQLYALESWNRLQDAVQTALLSGAPYELVLEMIRADGTRRWVMARGSHSAIEWPLRRASRHRPGHHGASACRTSAVERERPSHRGPGVGTRQDRPRPARRHWAAPRRAAIALNR